MPPSHQQLLEIFDAAPVAMAHLDLQGQILYANRALLQIAGYSLEDLQGRRFDEFVHPDDRAAARGDLEALAAGRRDRYEADRRYRLRDGNVRWAHGTASLVRRPDGAPDFCVAVLQDITERKQAEEEKREFAEQVQRERRRLRAIVANVPGVVWEAWGQPDARTQRIDFVSDYVETMLGYSVDEWLATPNFWLSIVHPDDRDRAAREAMAIFAGKRGGTSEFRWVAKDGRVLWVEAQSTVVLDDRGQPAGMRGVTMNITERKQAEQAVQESEARFRSLFEQSPLSIQIFAPDGRTLRVNKAWERLWGVTLAQIGDYNILQDEQLRQRGIMPFIEAAFAGEATPIPPIEYDPELTIPNLTRFENTRRWVSAFIFPVKDETGSIVEIVLVHEDITARERAEQERAELLGREQALRAEAETASRLKDEFLAMLSHELRTPLNAILGWARMLSSGAKLAPEMAHRAIEVIERNARAQAQLVEDLLDVSRIIRGNLRLNLQRLDLVPVVWAALDTVRPTADVKQIRIDTAFEAHDASVTGDPARLQQVVWNLLSNAVRFTGTGGRVAVSVRADQSEIELMVSDTGQGISPDFLPYVFDRFRQGDASTTRAHAGLGLGLAIVRHLVELHGGTVSVESAGEGLGAMFRVRLPAAAAGSGRGVAPAGVPLESRPRRLEGAKILLVDADPTVHAFVKACLEAQGAAVTAVESPSQAFDRLAREAVDLLLVEVEGATGESVSLVAWAGAISHRRGGAVRAIALTKDPSRRDEKILQEAGFERQLAKPIDSGALVECAAALVRRPWPT